MTTRELIEDAARRVQSLLQSNPPSAVVTELYILADCLSELDKRVDPTLHYLREMGDRAGHYTQPPVASGGPQSENGR